MIAVSIALISIVLVAGWAFVAGYVSAAKKWLDEPGNDVRAGLWVAAPVVAGLAVIVWALPEDAWLYGVAPLPARFIADLAPELTGLAITVIVLDELGRNRARQQYKRDINDAKLWNVNFEGAVLLRANLQGAIYNEHTIWPVGFDYGLAGAIYDNRISPDTVWSSRPGVSGIVRGFLLRQSLDRLVNDLPSRNQHNVQATVNTHDCRQIENALFTPPAHMQA